MTRQDNIRHDERRYDMTRQNDIRHDERRYDMTRQDNIRHDEIRDKIWQGKITSDMMR